MSHCQGFEVRLYLPLGNEAFFLVKSPCPAEEVDMNSLGHSTHISFISLRENAFLKNSYSRTQENADAPHLVKLYTTNVPFLTCRSEMNFHKQNAGLWVLSSFKKNTRKSRL